MTGYCDPPAGVEEKKELHYNPYFPGGFIAMARNIYDGVVDFDDEHVPATSSQIAKDVSTFLKWAAEPELEERRLLAARGIILTGVSFLGVLYLKRHVWSYLKTKRFIYKK